MRRKVDGLRQQGIEVESPIGAIHDEIVVLAGGRHQMVRDLEWYESGKIREMGAVSLEYVGCRVDWKAADLLQEEGVSRVRMAK